MAELPAIQRGNFEKSSIKGQTYGMSFREMVSLGLVRGSSLLSYGATISGLSTSDNEVAFREGPKLTFPADLSASTVYLVSTAADVGTYKIQGIDANGDYAEASVTATGTTPVAFSGTWNHVQRCISTSATNAGTVYVSTKSDAGAPSTTAHQIQTVMLAGKNYAINPVLVCPNNSTILIYEFDFSSNADNDTTVTIFANRQGMWIENFKFFVGFQFAQEFQVPVKLYEGDKIRVTVEAAAGTATSATFGMNGLVLTNSEFRLE